MPFGAEEECFGAHMCRYGEGCCITGHEDVEVWREFVCSMYADDVGCGQRRGQENIVENDQRASVASDVSFPLLQTDEGRCSKVSQLQSNGLGKILNVIQIGGVAGAVGMGCTV